MGADVPPIETLNQPQNPDLANQLFRRINFVGEYDGTGENPDNPLQKLIDRGPQKPDINPEQLNEYKKQTLDLFEKNGLVSTINTENGPIYILESLSSFAGVKFQSTVKGEPRDVKLTELLRNKRSKMYYSREFGKCQTSKTLYWMFKDSQVITREDYSTWEASDKHEPIPTRSLYYIPDTVEAAYDINKIRESRNTFYLMLSDTSRSWSGVYPTRDKDFNSQLTIMEASVPQIVYGLGEGFRENDDGPLMVKKIINKPISYPDNVTQRITREWFEENGFKIFENRTGSTVRTVLNQQGQNILSNNILKLTDFPPEVKRDTNKVDDTGCYWWKGHNIKFHIGDKFIGCKILQLSTTEFVVWDKNGIPTLYFTSEFDPKFVTPYKLNKSKSVAINVNDGAYKVKGPINDVFPKSFIEHRPEKRRMKNFNIQIEIEALVEFRDQMRDVFGERIDLNQFSIIDQFAIRHQYSQLPQEHTNNFINKFGNDGLALLRDGFLTGRLDERILNLGDLDDYLIKDLLIPCYHNLHLIIDKFEHKFRKSLSLVDQKQKFGTNILVERMFEAFRNRSLDFLTVASQPGYTRMAFEEINMFTETLDYITKIFDDQEKTTLHKRIVENKSKNGDTANFVTLEYTDPARNSLKIISRPYETREESYRAQARIAFEYTRSDGKTLSIRLDLDPYGVSLDIGKPDSQLANMFEDLNLSHHTQGPFSITFEGKNIFAENIRLLSTTLGYEFEPKPNNSG